MNDILIVWQKIEIWMQETFPHSGIVFRDGLKDEEFSVLNSYIPILPNDFTKLWKLHDGEIQKSMAHPILGFVLLEIEIIIYLLESWNQIAHDMDEDGINEIDGIVYPPNTAKNDYINRNYLFFAQDFRGSYLVIDLDPDKLGLYGQITHIGNEDKDRYVISANLFEFFILIDSLNKDKRMKIGPNEDGNPTQYWQLENGKKLYNLLSLLPHLYLQDRLLKSTNG